MLIQSGIEDERDELLEEISMLETFCEETKNLLETQVANDEDMLSNAQTKLAAATGVIPDTKPVKLPVPATSSLAEGLVVPTPTFPPCSITKGLEKSVGFHTLKT